MVNKFSERLLMLCACCSSLYALTSSIEKTSEGIESEVVSTEMKEEKVKEQKVENKRSVKSHKKNNVKKYDSVLPSFTGMRKSDHGNMKINTFRADNKKNTIQKVNPIPEDMVLVKGGSFTLGRTTNDDFEHATPYGKITISDFYMDKAEVTNGDYKKYIKVLKEMNKMSKQFEKKTLDEIKITDNNFSYYELQYLQEKKLSKEYIQAQMPRMELLKRDFPSIADTYIKNYYGSTDYEFYPVICITYDNAVNYAQWRSLYLNEFQNNTKKDLYPNFTLPSYAQWTYAANGGIEWCNIYSWGGMYARDEEGNLRQNFKASKGNYNDDGKGYTFTSRVDAYKPNNFGLYDMGGNVKEWVNDVYDLSLFNKDGSLDPVCIDENNPVKIVVSGSFHSPIREVQLGNIDYEHKCNARGDLGFRCVMPCPGTKEPQMVSTKKKRR